MPSDTDRAALHDILHHLDLIREFTQDENSESFYVDIMRIYAVTRCLEIISEASRRVSDDVKARNQAIACKEMAGAGNIYRHDYEDVSAKRLWDTVQLALPALRAVIVAELEGSSLQDT